ncbi:hypothetical protein CBR_g40915 [Chara braunii]|uniref:tRNA nucleotidyltransferase/poly(A) polymerase RNA and SrmB- binding domain-containing protein n=1 Tax=Chara braunii TaxID=69332 RepID=A0A388K2G9_CHABU|nr:hypothetical protein CBR_g40915 [Chara braunii]|eukprot:GBG64215.1 hypothetical protein CBR_g40915 [Chara braunii]
MLELNTLMAYGSAEPSVRLLWRYRLLEMLLPFHASYFSRLNFKRQARRSNFALDLLRTLDQVNSPDRPCHGALWVALAAFHLAAAELSPRTVVMAAAALACGDRKGLHDAARRARIVYERIETEARKARENMEEDADAAAINEESEDSNSSVGAVSRPEEAGTASLKNAEQSQKKDFEDEIIDKAAGNKTSSKSGAAAKSVEASAQKAAGGGGAVSRPEEAGAASLKNAEQSQKTDCEDEIIDKAAGNKKTASKSGAAAKPAETSAQKVAGSLKQIAREARALGGESLSALRKMTDASLTANEIFALTGLKAHGQVKHWIVCRQSDIASQPRSPRQRGL